MQLAEAAEPGDLRTFADADQGLIAVTVGVLLLDVTMQSGMTANLTRIYAIHPDSRLNTTYMTCGFVGGSTGSCSAPDSAPNSAVPPSAHSSH